MAIKIIFTDRADKQLNEILDYFERNAYDYDTVKKFRAAMLAVVDLISAFPEAYPEYEDSDFAGLRKATIRKFHYVMAYTIVGDVVYIERIYHMKQDYIRALK